MKTKTKPIKPSAEIHAKIESIAKELGMPMTQVINMLANQWIKENRTKESE